ncbi:MAG: sulfatase-like hydrolase/transferase [Archangium sp.]
MNRDFWRGARAAGLTWGLLALALLPSRMAVAMRVRGGSLFERVTRALAGTVLDFSHASWLVALSVVLVVTLLLVAPRTRAFATGFASVLAALPWCVVLYLVTVTEQEVKAERGAFSTLREMLNAAAEPSFVEGAPGFIRYQRILIPALVCGSAFVVVLVLRWRARRSPAVESRRAWTFGLVAALLVGVVSARAAVRVLDVASTSRLGPSGVGDPLDSVLESAVDSLAGRAPPGPLELLADWKPSQEMVVLGTSRLGWPARGVSCPHPYARPLDRGAAPAEKLLQSFDRLSQRLFADGDGRVLVLQLSLEGFRADDLQALNARAAPTLAPFINGLAKRPHPGVLISRGTYQAGVRTAQGLAAMTCGLGTLPWNLSLIRDLDAQGKLPLRCAGDVLAASGFTGTFFYGSDADYDQMGPFLLRHGMKRVVAEKDFPESAPRGAWGGVTDFALFDEAVKQLGAGVKDAPQYALLMSLSNHSPFTVPQDLPDDVRARAAALIGASGNVASADDLRRLITFSYTDAAVERLFAALERDGLAERTVVLLMADHSTGDTYVWGADDFDHETDAAKTQVPFLIVVPQAWVTRAAAQDALEDVQRALDAEVLSQNDVPTVLLALLSAHPGVVALPASERWHTLGGQRTSSWFDSGVEGAALMGVNGVDESFVLDAKGVRRWPYEDAVFLRTKGDRDRVTPRLAPAAATLLDLAGLPACSKE